ncbi:MAG TPA: radical SAM protein [Anaerolineales bacterium]|nr:radical SAM protein [Anaerolineales bacterium]
MIRDIQAKTILSRVKGEDDWFGLYYNFNLYRGCQHQCIYCDSRSECYQIEDFNHDVLVKVNAIDLLRRELAGKRVIGTIGTGSMNDPYMPLEAERRLTRQALEAIAEFHFPIHIITKSDLVLRDLDLLKEIGRVYAAVSFTVTTAEDALSKKLEPGAPASSRRLAAMKTLSENGILTGVTLMPILPFIEDTPENIGAILRLAHENGAGYIIPAFGMTLRDRQRSYYYEKLDHHFPGLRTRYERAFGERYSAKARDHFALEKLFGETCRKYELAARMPVFTPQKRLHGSDGQLKLF